MATAKEINAKAREHAMTALEHRRKGLTYKAIGVVMCISGTRVRQLIMKAERILRRESESIT